MTQPGTPQVIGDLVRDRARRYGDKVFLRFLDETFTYAEIDRLSDACARGFLHLGVGKDDKVSFMLPNCPEFVQLWFGAGEDRGGGGADQHLLQGRVPAAYRGSIRFEDPGHRRAVRRATAAYPR